MAVSEQPNNSRRNRRARENNRVRSESFRNVVPADVGRVPRDGLNLSEGYIALDSSSRAERRCVLVGTRLIRSARYFHGDPAVFYRPTRTTRSRLCRRFNFSSFFFIYIFSTRFHGVVL